MQKIISLLLEFSGQIKNKKYFFILAGYLLIIVSASSPIIIAVLSELIYNCFGSGNNNCESFGIPIGMIVNSMMFSAFLTIPLGIIALIVWTVYLIVILIRNNNKNKRTR